MKTIYGDIPQSEIEKQNQYLYGSMISLLYLKEENYEFLDQRIQTIINQLKGSMKLFDSTPKILSMIAWLESARIDEDQFRKNILDAANMVDKLKGGNSDV